MGKVRSSFFPAILFVIVTCTGTSGQERFTDNLKVAAHYHYGFLVPEYDYFLQVTNAPMQGFVLSLSKGTTGKTDFERLYNYPEWGVSLYYATLGNGEVFGKEVAVFPYYRLSFVTRNRFNLFHELGFGLGYVTKVFDFESNYWNIAVGSHFNFHFNFKLGASYRISRRTTLNAGISFDHFSNANTAIPNIGINYGSAVGGLSVIVGRETSKVAGELAPHQRKFNFEIVGGFGAKRTREVLESDWYYTASISGEVKWAFLRALHLGVGADMFLDPSAKSEMESQQRTDFQHSNNYQTGVHLSQEFIYSRLSLTLQEGFYLGLTDKVNHEKMYHRAVARYMVAKKVFVQVAMKANWVVLDYPEFGVGVKWK